MFETTDPSWVVVHDPTDVEWAVVDVESEPETDGLEKADKLNGCSPGDHVSAPRFAGVYYHHGVLLSNHQILHVNAGPHSGLSVCLGMQPAMLRVDPVDRFLKGATSLTRVVAGDVKCAEEAAQKANGLVPYNLFQNNCEHNASRLAGNPTRSVQSENAVSLMMGVALFWVNPWLAIGAASVLKAALGAFASGDSDLPWGCDKRLSRGVQT